MNIGLDIGSKSIKIVELSREGQGYSLRAAAAVGYTGTPIEKIEDDRGLVGVSDIVKKLVSDAKIATRDVAISLPENHVYTRLVKFPLLNDAEIASAVKWEAPEYIPIPSSEAVIEYQVLERRENSTPPQVLVLLVAVNRVFVEKYIKVAEKAGLRVTSVESELFSIVRAFSPGEGVEMFVDIGGNSTNIAVAVNGQLYLARSISTAGAALTRAVSQSLGVSETQAEEYKRTYGLAESQLEGKVAAALSPLFRLIGEETKKALHYYQMEVKGAMPSQVVLTGGAAGMSGATSALAAHVGMEVVVGNPFEKIILDKSSAESLGNYAPLYPVAVGLAMRE